MVCNYSSPGRKTFFQRSPVLVVEFLPSVTISVSDMGREFSYYHERGAVLKKFKNHCSIGSCLEKCVSISASHLRKNRFAKGL